MAPPQPERERKRVRLACSNCHRGKIKCDGERPCDRCIKKGLAPEECVDFQRKRTACTSCRAVKMKCDGNRPCKRCLKKGKGEECTDVENNTFRRPRPEHRVARDDGSGDDGHRPVPYNYDEAAAAAAAAAGYYYGPPPWAYHHPMPGGHWAPYGPPVYPHPHAHPYGPPHADDERRGEQNPGAAAMGHYTPALRSSYPHPNPEMAGMSGHPELQPIANQHSAASIDPALDSEGARNQSNENGASATTTGLVPVQADGWREILHASSAAVEAGARNAPGSSNYRGDNDDKDDEDVDEKDVARAVDADEDDE